MILGAVHPTWAASSNGSGGRPCNWRINPLPGRLQAVHLALALSSPNLDQDYETWVGRAWCLSQAGGSALYFSCWALCSLCCCQVGWWWWGIRLCNPEGTQRQQCQETLKELSLYPPAWVWWSPQLFVMLPFPLWLGAEYMQDLRLPSETRLLCSDFHGAKAQGELGW